jgi:hypothetical protein
MCHFTTLVPPPLTILMMLTKKVQKFLRLGLTTPLVLGIFEEKFEVDYETERWSRPFAARSSEDSFSKVSTADSF